MKRAGGATWVLPQVSLTTTTSLKMEAMRATTDQLRIEAQINRKKVSECAKDHLEFCEKGKAGDALVSGPPDNHNPFQEKKSCSIV